MPWTRVAGVLTLGGLVVGCATESARWPEGQVSAEEAAVIQAQSACSHEVRWLKLGGPVLLVRNRSFEQCMAAKGYPKPAP